MTGEWQKRSEMMLGADGLEKLARARVAVVGIGGVGGFAAEFLVRCGVGHIVLIDADDVSLTNVNRQIIALHSTVGRPKVDVMAERLRDINPQVDITTHKVFLEEGNVRDLLGAIDCVIDAIDTLSPKLTLINHCLDHGIKIISSMGAGAKRDISQIEIADISKSHNCPLARMVRKRLRREKGITKGLPVIYSRELPEMESIVYDRTERNKNSMVGTMPYLPAAFGLFAVQWVVSELTK